MRKGKRCSYRKSDHSRDKGKKYCSKDDPRKGRNSRKNTFRERGDKGSGTETNIHHIIPRSRDGSDSPYNRVRINKGWHEAYHRLFGNMKPVEVMVFLMVNVWGCRWYLLLHAYKKQRRVLESSRRYQV